jgi:glycosyltransferase 2 family protein
MSLRAGWPEAPLRYRAWKWTAACVAALAAIWLLYHALTSRGFDWHLAVFSFTHVRLVWLLLALVFIYSTYWGRALRWTVFLRPLKPRPSMRNLLSATLVGFTAINLLGRPGEFVRPYLIAVKEEVPIASQLAAWVLERIADLLMVLLLFGFALIHTGSSTVVAGSKLGWLLAAGGRIAAFLAGFTILLIIAFRHFAQPAHRFLMRVLGFLPASLHLRLEKLSAAFIQGVESTRSDGALLLILLYSALEWLLIVLTYWCLVASFTELNLTFVDLIVFMGFVSIAASIQIPGVGGGVQIMAVLVLTEIFRVRVETASAFAFLIWIITFVAVIPAGLLIAMREGLGWNRLHRLATTESPEMSQ